MFLTTLLLAWIAVAAGVAWFYRRALRELWREPVLCCPVLIIESDDWGAGPAPQAVALDRLRELLLGFRDAFDQPPVMTLAVVLAVADTAAIARSGLREYQRVTLVDSAHAPVRRAMLAGARAGVFGLQLHGMEHYRPATLMRVANRAGDDAVAVAEWLCGERRPTTEQLPSALQSRWTDASSLPSRDLDRVEIASLVNEETAAFARIFGHPPRVVVPPTFQWTEAVERAWANAGVETLISPGRRQVARGADGALVPEGSRQFNGERGGSGMAYLIRDAWFEPAMGHRAAKGLAAIAQRNALGRPTLLETHRFNFIGDAGEASFEELKLLLEQALAVHPRLRFVSSEVLGRALVERDPRWLEGLLRRRLAVFLQRLSRVPRLGRLARLGVFGVPLGLAQRLFPSV